MRLQHSMADVQSRSAAVSGILLSCRWKSYTNTRYPANDPHVECTASIPWCNRPTSLQLILFGMTEQRPSDRRNAYPAARNFTSARLFCDIETNLTASDRSAPA